MVNETLILNTSLYTVKFTDVTEAEYSANIIAENMWEQYDNVVNQVQLMEDFFKHRSYIMGTPIVLHVLAFGLDTHLGSTFTSRRQVRASQMAEYIHAIV